MERNLSLYGWYRMLGDAMAWLPVFFLYLNAHLSLAEVLRLEALYYLAVVVVEVPSGYFSDKVGRKATLIVASAAFVFAYTVFIWADGFWTFALAQLALAVGMAFRSGTDTAFLYDSLHSLGRAREYASREAGVERRSLFASSSAVVLGGISAVFDLVFAYWISLAAAAGSLLVALAFVEPGGDAGARAGSGFVHQLSLCLKHLKDRHLAWLFAFSNVAYVLAHVPYEFYQPYLALLDVEDMLPVVDTPAASGILFGVTMALAAWAVGHGVRLQRRFGLHAVLLCALALQFVVVAALSSWLHTAVIVLLFFRNVPMALAHAPMYAAIAPRVATTQRATYLSVQSLADRLAFSATLALVSTGLDIRTADWPTLSSVLSIYAAFGAVALIGLLITQRSLAK